MSLAIKMIALFRPQGAVWNPNDKQATISLSNGNLTATRASLDADNHACVRANLPQSAGKLYFEVTLVGSASGVNQVNVGLVRSDFLLGGDFQYPGTLQTGGGVGYLYGNGQIQINGSGVASPDAITTNGTIGCFAVDLDAKLFWGRKNGGNWNGSPTADPATGTGGLDISTVLPGDAYICVDVRVDTGNGATLNSGTSGFAATPPSGFEPWGLA